MTPKDLPELPEPECASAYHAETLVYAAEEVLDIQREAYDLGARSTAAQPAAEQEPVVPVSVLSGMVEPLEGVDSGQPGYHWRRGWNDALRRAMDYARPPAASGDSTPPSASSVPYRAISQVLASEMKRAVTNGANSVSMPDELVEIAAWLAGIQGDPSGAPRAEPEAWLIRMSDGRRTVHTHNAIGDYRAIDPDATVVELFPRASAHLTGALRQQPEAVGQGRWQPIETAPKDGTVIDLWIGGEFPRREAECYWGKPHHECGEMGRLCDSDWHDLEDGWVPGHGLFEFSLSDGEITHWMPEPEPPQAASGCSHTARSDDQEPTAGSSHG